MWDASATTPRYNSEKCDMRGGERCVANGKPDNGYLHWRWQPAGCNLSALDPAEFLQAVRGKRLAFVGDSIARTQAEALVCLLSTFSRPETVHRHEERLGRKFWRWVFPPPHNVSVSTYWSPFLVRDEVRPEDYATKHRTVILDALSEPWTADVDAVDVVVISVGHWFRLPATYYDDGVVKTGIDGGYIGAYRTAMRRALEHVNANSTTDKLVVVATIAPAHFDAKYGRNHRDSCSRQKPYEEWEAADVAAAWAELRKAALEEMAAASARRRRRGLKFEVLDVTRLASMRPDGHPGVYIYKNAYGGGQGPETAANDCLHWCAPGPVDTFNDILMKMVVASG
uniref:Uncharacterized protein n=1 Tax=Avena sativa TaxID=4498 RepID=A0ACD6ADM7_AVESA